MIFVYFFNCTLEVSITNDSDESVNKSQNVHLTTSTAVILNTEPVSLTYNSSKVNFTVNQTDNTEILEMHLGPRKKSVTFTVIMSIVYILIFTCGLFGNICICFVIICNACMHNTTNYYLFSLAVSDVLLVLFGEYLIIKLGFNLLMQKA